MLVIGRYENESIVINDDIEIMICRVRGKKVRVGISAPKNVLITRKELLDQSEPEDRFHRKGFQEINVKLQTNIARADQKEFLKENKDG
jgi:carbon storage regulator